MEVDEGYLGNFYKFRFTLPDRELAPRFDDCIMQLFKVFDISEGSVATQWWTVGYEELNGYGEDSKPHFHIHFASLNPEDRLRKRLQALFKKDDFIEWTSGLKGNRLYSLKNVDVDEGGVRDLNRFFRYPFKQVLESGRAYEVKMEWQRPPPDFDLRTQTLIAHDEWLRDVEFKKNARQRAEAPTTKDKLFEWLDGRVGLGDTPITKRGLLLLIIEFYAQERKSANKQTILGYLQTALWAYNIESLEETTDKWLKEA